MLELHNTTRYPAECTFLQDIDGARHLMVAVKPSFHIDTRGAAEATEGPGLVHDIVYNGEPGQSSVRYESDFALGKPGTDIIVNGQAFGFGRTSVYVDLRVGTLTKRLRVCGKRYWDGFSGSSLTEPEPFDTMPVTYENAYGGIDTVDRNMRGWEPRNPVGRGFATKSSRLAGQLGPSVEYPSQPINSWSDRPKPGGFGAIARHWQPRAGYAGTYDAEWERERFPLLPRDYDPRFAQHAPTDQQTDYLIGNEPVELTNMTSAASWSFSLPRVHFALTTRIGAEDIEHRARLHTVILEPEAARCTLVWCSSLRCHGKEYQIGYITLREKEVVTKAR